MTFGQADTMGSKTWKVETLVELLSNVGGLAFSLAAFLQFFFSKRTEYCYDISRLKRFFYFAKEDDSLDNKNSADYLG